MNNKNIAVLGSGQVGEILANGFLAHGHAVMRASREPAKLAAWKQGAKGTASVGTFAEAAAWGDIVVLAVKGTAAEEVVASLAAQLAGKTVIDTTNPIASAPPVNGVIQYFTGPNDSLMERLQKRVPAAHFVKAWNSVGNALMVNPKLPATPTMFICGNDAGAKQQTTELLTQFGWDSLDCGAVEGARAIEPLCILWCIPGFVRNDWAHAFKMLWPA
jgi:predicted dinucleotide-binding enzyme